ncbi:hypothetical protein Ade02nite_20350 [Paractinoplanes deccanensis]|uniref:Uncharacterized protein n=1 Tax=Paractinoplanes deccanensis TaxID=113561 RepID=A0ABQ3Y079_9ACTN|nr:hypothetical protein [Actinoplanes deccanensis]GID73394.1 hypothetical protein Ade02nite_20350 [Actinoplanes deccanensis]
MPGILPPTPNMTDALIEDTIRAHPDWSDEQIAADFGDPGLVTADRVAQVRERM